MTMIGKYTLLGDPMVGGLGRVFKAVIPGESKYYAIKFPKDQNNPFHCKALRDEARALARIEHPNIVRMVDSNFDGDLIYIVMDFMHKGSLSKYLNEPLAPELVALMLIQVGDALAAYHNTGGFHRDIKPDNILLGMEGEWQFMLSDASLAKVPIEGIPSTRHVGGTPGYIDPWVQACFYDAAADIYSLGISAAVALTSSSPKDVVHQGQIETGHLLAQLPETSIHTNLIKLVAAMTKQERKLRPTATIVSQYAQAVLAGGTLPELPDDRPAQQQPNAQSQDLAEALLIGGVVAFAVVALVGLLSRK
jgi:serine/threonine protein kinase